MRNGETRCLGPKRRRDVWRLVSLVSLGQWLGNLCSKSSVIIVQAGTSWDLSFPFVSLFVHVFLFFLVVRSQAWMFQIAWPIALPHSHPFPDLRERFNVSMGVFDVFVWGRLNRWDLHWLFYHYEDWRNNDVFKTFGWQSICSFLFNLIISWFDLARVLLVVTPYKVKIDGTEGRLGIRAHKKSETSRGECAIDTSNLDSIT